MIGRPFAKEVFKAFAISAAATFGSMTGLIAFGYVAEKYMEHRPDSYRRVEETDISEEVNEAVENLKKESVKKRSATMEAAGYKEPEIDEALKDVPVDPKPVVNDTPKDE
jgi:hypothetical protein